MGLWFLGLGLLGVPEAAQLEAFWCCPKLILGAAAESFEKRHFLRRGRQSRNFVSQACPCSVVFCYNATIIGYFRVRPELMFGVIKLA